MTRWAGTPDATMPSITCGGRRWTCDARKAELGAPPTLWTAAADAARPAESSRIAGVFGHGSNTSHLQRVSVSRQLTAQKRLVMCNTYHAVITSPLFFVIGMDGAGGHTACMLAPTLPHSHSTDSCRQRRRQQQQQHHRQTPPPPTTTPSQCNQRLHLPALRFVAEAVHEHYGAAGVMPQPAVRDGRRYTARCTS